MQDNSWIHTPSTLPSGKEIPEPNEAGWVGPRAILDTLNKKISCPCQESNEDFSVVEPIDYT